MSRAFPTQNERAIGAVIALDTLTNMVIESQQQTFTKEAILRLAGHDRQRFISRRVRAALAAARAEGRIW